MNVIASRTFVLLAAGLLYFSNPVLAAEVKVMISGGVSAAYSELVPQYERATGNTVTTARGSSMGDSPTSIPGRMRRGEPVDVLIMVGDALDDLLKAGKVVPGSRVDLARSLMGMAVRAGAPKPDISSVEAFKRAMIGAKSVAYSESASGVYLSTKLFPRLGIADIMTPKSKMVIGEPVGAAVARGEAEIAFQQMSELRPVKGIEIVGPLPPELQVVTIFSAGIAVGAKDANAARGLIAFLASPAAAGAIEKSGMEPIATAAK
jgi:molybdate transport system substrate-binding protein